MALKPKITREYIKEKVGDQNVFNFYFGDYELCKSFNSIFREDKKKSAAFLLSKNGTVIYKDFATGDTYDCVTFVMQLLKLNYYHALQQIAVDFDLINGEKSSEKIAVIKKISAPAPKIEKIISVDSIRFRKPHLEFWAQFGITEDELKANDVYAVSCIYINDYQIATKEGEVKFAYIITDDEGKQYIKVYAPYSTEYKWLTNAPLNVPFGLHNLEKQSDTLIITKSQKDRILLKKYFTDVIALQNESGTSLNEDVARVFKKMYKNVYIWFDYDRPGIKAVNYYKKHYGFKPVFSVTNKKTIWQNLTHVKKTGIKDPSDFVKRFGLPIFEQYLKHIKLLP